MVRLLIESRFRAHKQILNWKILGFETPKSCGFVFRIPLAAGSDEVARASVSLYGLDVVHGRLIMIRKLGTALGRTMIGFCRPLDNFLTRAPTYESRSGGLTDPSLF